MNGKRDTFYWLGLLLAVGLAGSGCSSATDPGGSDSAADRKRSERDDSFMNQVGGKGDQFDSIQPGSSEAKALLEFVNTASFETLDDDVALDVRAAHNIVDTRKDGDIASLRELDRIPWVGSRAFGKLLTYARENGIFGDTTNDTVHGVELDSPVAHGMLQLVNRASVETLDLAVGLDSRVAEYIGQARRSGRLENLKALDQVSRVENQAFQKMRTYALSEGFVYDESNTVHGVAVGSPEAKGMRRVALTASETVLDDDVGLDSRAATNLVEARLEGNIDGLASLDNVSYLGQRGFDKLLQYAKDNGAIRGSCAPLDYERIGADFGRSALAVEPNGDAHLVFNASSPDAGHLLNYAHRPAGGSWSIEPIATDLTTLAGNDIRPQDGKWELELALDAHGGLHTVFWAEQTNFYKSAIQLRYGYRPRGGSWNFTGLDGTYLRHGEPGTVDGRRIAMDVASTEKGPRVYVLSARNCYRCTDEFEGEVERVQYHRVEWPSWSATTDVGSDSELDDTLRFSKGEVPNAERAKSLSLSVDRTGTLHASYHEPFEVHYRTARPTHENANWSPAELAVPEDGSPYATDVDMEVGPDGSQIAFTRGDDFFVASRQSDGNWSETLVADEHRTDMRDLDFALDATGTTHLLATVRNVDFQGDVRGRDLWYDVGVGAPNRELIPKHDKYREWQRPELDVAPDGTSHFVVRFAKYSYGTMFWRRCR